MSAGEGCGKRMKVFPHKIRVPFVVGRADPGATFH